MTWGRLLQRAAAPWPFVFGPGAGPPPPLEALAPLSWWRAAAWHVAVRLFDAQTWAARHRGSRDWVTWQLEPLLVRLLRRSAHAGANALPDLHADDLPSWATMAGIFLAASEAHWAVIHRALGTQTKRAVFGQWLGQGRRADVSYEVLTALLAPLREPAGRELVAQQIATVRTAPSWMAAVTIARQRWQRPAYVRGLLVAAGRPDAPWWAWAQLQHRHQLLQAPPLLPWPAPSLPSTGLLRTSFDINWSLFRGTQPEVEEIPALWARSPWVRYDSLRQWLLAQPDLRAIADEMQTTVLGGDSWWTRRQRRRGGRDVLGRLLAIDGAQRSWPIPWHGGACGQRSIYHDGPWADRLCRWVRLDVAGLAAAAAAWHTRPAGSSAERDALHLICSQIAARSTISWLQPLREDTPVGWTPALLAQWREAMLTGARTQDLASRSLSSWGWWAESEPVGRHLPPAARALGWSLRVIAGWPTAWGQLVELDPAIALRLLVRLGAEGRPPAVDVRALKPFLLSPDKAIRTLALQGIGLWGSADRAEGFPQDRG